MIRNVSFRPLGLSSTQWCESRFTCPLLGSVGPDRAFQPAKRSCLRFPVCLCPPRREGRERERKRDSWRAPLGLRSTERLRAKEEENRLAGWLKCYRFLAAQGQGGKRTVLKWLIFAVPRCRFARVRRTARSSPGLYQATFCSRGSSACYFRYRWI